MKKVLYLSLVASSIFSMQLDRVKTNRLQEKSSQYNSSNIGGVNKIRIQPSSIFVPNRLGSVELYHGKKGFSVCHDDKKYTIQKCFTDPMVRNITKEQLYAFLQAGYLSLNQMNDGEFSLKAKGRINGGGPGLGAFMYWTTKTLCYTAGLTAIGTAAVVTGGTVVPAMAGAAAGTGAVAGIAVGSAAVASGTGSAIITTAGVLTVTAATGGSVAAAAGVSSAIITAAAATTGGAAATATITTATGAVIASGATAGGIVLGIEALSVAVGTFFGMLPTP